MHAGHEPAAAASTAAPQASTVALPADEAHASQALDASPRHGEWVDVAVPGSSDKVRVFVVYPERPDKAPVVLVVHEVFGLSAWVRGVADRLAAEGFFAIVPDLLWGKGSSG